MPLYTLNQGKLTQINEIKFGLEKDIQKIVENNLKHLFNLEFIASEFSHHGLRVDTLGFDKESKSFVIIEYKNDRNFTVIDQGYAYLALLLNNKAEFILKYNETKEKEDFLKKDSVEWSQSRIIFISPVFTTYQRKAIEFKDLPIELWEIKQYSNNVISLNQLIPSEESESITTLNIKSDIVKRINQEIVVYSEETHLQLANEKIKSLYLELKDLILGIDNNIKINPKKLYLAFTHNKTFIYMSIKKNSLNLHILVGKSGLNDPLNISKEITSEYHGLRREYEIILDERSNLEYVSSLIRQAYEQN
jgi:predicted transport protein